MLIYCGNNPIILPNSSPSDNNGDYGWKTVVAAIIVWIIITYLIFKL